MYVVDYAEQLPFTANVGQRERNANVLYIRVSIKYKYMFSCNMTYCIWIVSLHLILFCFMNMDESVLKYVGEEAV